MTKKFLTAIDMGSQAITNVATPSSANDAVNKAYVDAIPAAVSGVGGVFPFTFNTSTLEAGITGNQLRGNNATFTASTKLWVMEVTLDGLDVSLGLSRIKVGRQVYVQDYTSAARYAIFNVTADAIDKGAYWEIAVSLSSSLGTVPGGKIAFQSVNPGSIGLPVGGTTNQVLGKTSNADYAVSWRDDVSGGGGGTPVGTKMTALTALTGAGAATTDIIEVVDISDTTMAASGTNKKMTFAELINGIKAQGGAVPDGDKGQISVTAGAWSLDADTVTNTQLAPMATLTIKGNATGSTAGPTDMSVYTVQGLLRRPIIADTTTAFAPVVATHENTMVTLSNASAITVTLPSNATSAFAIGAEVDFLWLGTGQPTFAAGGGATVNATPGLKLRAQYSAATAKKISTNGWVVLGDLSA